MEAGPPDAPSTMDRTANWLYSEN
ncbi:uncharacterized protein METZ01_LOCUS348861, partial [marine metagenome]